MKKKEQIKEKLLDQLIANGKIAAKDRALYAAAPDLEGLEAALAKSGAVGEDDLVEAKSALFALPTVKIGDAKISADLLQILPRDIAENYRMVIFDRRKDELSLALVDPANLKAREAADFIARDKGYTIRYFLCSPSSFHRALQQYGSLKSEVGEALRTAEDRFEGDLEGADDQSKIEKVIRSAPISKMVSVILKHAVESRASDIHIEPSSGESRVRYRIDGNLHNSLVLPKYIHAAIVSRIKVMANLKIDETRLPQDGRIRLNIDGRFIDFRVSTLPLYSQEKVVMRILDTSGGIAKWEKLGFEGKNLAIMYDNITKPHGMFLVTGPTGSGKSTTLYAALQILNSEDKNIVTLEDPVEYYLNGINQSQIRPEVNFTFASGLRSILRQDPDIIMVGEIRDSETAELAIHASLTGHTVLSTLHTNDAFGAIPRLMDMSVEPFLLASTLNVVIAQRLVRTICPECREEIDIPETLYQEVMSVYKTIPKENLPPDFISKTGGEIKHIYRGRGCAYCDNTGYKGRLAIVEVLDVNEAVKEIIYSANSLARIKDEFLKQGMLTLKQDGIIKAITGRTTVEEILTATKD